MAHPADRPLGPRLLQILPHARRPRRCSSATRCKTAAMAAGPPMSSAGSIRSSGQFLGMVLGAIDLSYFRDFYEALTAGRGHDRHPAETGRRGADQLSDDGADRRTLAAHHALAPDGRPPQAGYLRHPGHPGAWAAGRLRASAAGLPAGGQCQRLRRGLARALAPGDLAGRGGDGERGALRHPAAARAEPAAAAAGEFGGVARAAERAAGIDAAPAGSPGARAAGQPGAAGRGIGRAGDHARPHEPRDHDGRRRTAPSRSATSGRCRCSTCRPS